MAVSSARQSGLLPTGVRREGENKCVQNEQDSHSSQTDRVVLVFAIAKWGRAFVAYREHAEECGSEHEDDHSGSHRRVEETERH